MSNPLTTALLETIRVARERAEIIAQLREVISVALGMIADLNRELDRVRARYHQLLDERRRDRAA